MAKDGPSGGIETFLGFEIVLKNRWWAISLYPALFAVQNILKDAMIDLCARSSVEDL